MQSPCPAGEIEVQLEKILASGSFSGSRRRRELLTWSVERVLAGNTTPIKEHQIGVEVLNKPDSWDPRGDPAVRVEFNRLRQKLREFYDADGKDDAIVIEFPHRGYVPVFRERQPFDAPEEAPQSIEIPPDVFRVPSPTPHKSRLRSPWAIVFALVTAVTVVTWGTLALRKSLVAHSNLAPGRATPIALEGQVHNDYLRGVYEAQKETPESLRDATTLFNGIVRGNPEYALAYGARGRVHLDMASLAVHPAREEFARAKADLDHAIALDPADAQAQADLAWVNYALDWNWDLAEARFRQALRLSSGGAAHEMYGLGLMTRGRVAEADAHFRGAIERDPLNTQMRLSYAYALNEEGQPREAMEQVQFCLDRQPDWFPAQLAAADAAVYANRPGEALDHLAIAARLVPGNPLVLVTTAAAYAQQGRKADAETILQRIEGPQAVNSEYLRYSVAAVEALRGDSGQMFRWLDQSAELHEQQILYLKVDPLLAPYRDDPRMIALERRVGLQ